MKFDLQSLKLCLVTHRQNRPFSDYLGVILDAVRGGVTSVQLREKLASESDILEMARVLKTHLDPLGVPLIINDHLAIAEAVGAAGVHLGQQDSSLEEARALLGNQACIGLSIETNEELLLANRCAQLTYVAASAVFQSHTKQDCKTLWGLDGLRDFCKISVYPVVAIGGITIQNVSAVKDCGVSGVAIVGAIHDAESPRAAASAFHEIWELK